MCSAFEQILTLCQKCVWEAETDTSNCRCKGLKTYISLKVKCELSATYLPCGRYTLSMNQGHMNI